MSNSDKKLIFPFEYLENEKIVWEGGVSKNCFWAQFVEDIVKWFSIILLVFLFATLFFFASQSDSSNCDKKKTEKPCSEISELETAGLQKQNNKKIPFFSISKYLIVMCITLILPIIIVSILSRLKVKKFWYIITNERICIQRGLSETTIITIDIDKLISINTTQSAIERRLKLYSIDLIYSGWSYHRNIFGLQYNPNQIKFISVEDNLASKLTNEWLPRDNKKSV